MSLDPSVQGRSRRRDHARRLRGCAPPGRTGLLLILLLLAGCSTPAPGPTAAPSLEPSGVPPPALPSPSATAGPGPAATPSPGPSARPNAFSLGLPNTPGSLDPASAIDVAALIITRHMYEGLTRFAPGSTRAIPGLAEDWTVSEDGLTWTFQLRPNVRFSDGTPLTAQAAAENFERWLHRSPPGDYVFWRLMFGGFAADADQNGEPLARITDVEAVGPATLVLTLLEPDGSLPSTLAMPSFALVSPPAFQAGGFGTPDAGSDGTGPYLLKAWTGDIVTLARNPDYWGPPPGPDQLIFKAIPDDTQRLLALQSGEIEGMARVNPGHFPAVRADPALRLEMEPALNVLYLGFNHARAPWGNRDCREAVALALDPARYVRDFYPGDTEAAQAMQPPGVWGHAAPEGQRTRDAEAARGLWQACRAEEGSPPETIWLYVPPVPRIYLPEPAALGAAIQADLAAAGIDVRIASPDWQSEWLPAVRTGRADLFLLGLVGVNGDPDYFLCSLFCGVEAAFNSDAQGRPAPPDTRLGELLAAAGEASDPAAREVLYAEAHARIFESIPAIPIAHRQTAWAYRAAVTGTLISPIENVFFDLAWLP